VKGLVTTRYEYMVRAYFITYYVMHTKHSFIQSSGQVLTDELYRYDFKEMVEIVSL